MDIGELFKDDEILLSLLFEILNLPPSELKQELLLQYCDEEEVKTLLHKNNINHKFFHLWLVVSFRDFYKDLPNDDEDEKKEN